MKPLLLAACLLLLAPAARAGYGIPEEVTAKGEQATSQYINEHHEESHQLQMKVAQERYDNRQEQKAQVANALTIDSMQMQARLREAATAQERRIAEENEQYVLFSAVLLALALGAAVAWGLYRRRERLEVEAFFANR